MKGVHGLRDRALEGGSAAWSAVRAAVLSGGTPGGLREFRQWFEQNRKLKPLGYYAVWGAMMANYGSWLQAEAAYVIGQ